MLTIPCKQGNHMVWYGYGRIGIDYAVAPSFNILTFLSDYDYLGVQQYFGVVYHELITLRRVYFARAALTVRAK